MPSEASPPRPPRPWPRRIARVVFAACYTLLAAEVFLRCFAPQAVMPRYVGAGANGIRANQPGMSYWHTAPTFHVNMRINARGVRDDRELPYEKPAGTKRIVLLGDSYGMGYGVDLEDTFARVLERTLNAQGIACEVVNLSVSGFGSAEELVMLETEGFKYQPDLVLFQFNSSDPRETVASGLFALDGEKLVRAHATYLPAVGTQAFLSRFAAYRFVSEHSQLYVLLRERVAEFVKRCVMPAFRFVTRAGTPQDKENADTAYDDRLTLAVLQAARDACRKGQVQFAIADVPADRAPGDYATNEFWALPAVRAAQLPVVQPASEFMAHAKEELFDEWSNSHLTPLGNRILGEALARFVVEHQLLGSP